MRSRSHRENADVFDESLLALARLPAGLDLSRRRLHFFWQEPHPRALARLRAADPQVPILIGRYVAETPVRGAGLEYFCPADFFSLRALVDIELAGVAAREHWRGDPPPHYLNMSLVDGDLPRLRFWNEGLPAVATLAFLARACPGLTVTTDWLGARLARAAGLQVQRWRIADIYDRNWPPRRWLRERRSTRSTAGETAHRHESAGLKEQVDIVFALGGWVEERMLDTFPIRALAASGQRCRLWVHRHTAPLYALIAETGATYEDWRLPADAAGVESLQRAVRNWCRHAVRDGRFAPLRGRLAEAFIEVMAWPRWVPKLVAMHRLVTHWLQQSRPSLLIAPAEKDWGPYCALHAARHLGIPTIGVKHATWPPGSHLERYDDCHYVPSAADHVLAYSPMDAEVNRQVNSTGQPIVQWHGNPRLDKSMLENGSAPRPLQLLVGAAGAGAGRTMSLRRVAVARNIRLIAALHRELGDRIRVRLHSWDSLEQYPEDLRRLILPADESLQDQLARHAGLVATYSTIAFDGAAAGLPVFFWDYGELDMDRSEIAVRGGGVVAQDLETLCRAARRFLEDPLYHAELQKKAAALQRQLSHPAAERMVWIESVRRNHVPAGLPAVVSELVDSD